VLGGGIHIFSSFVTTIIPSRGRKNLGHNPVMKALRELGTVISYTRGQAQLMHNIHRGCLVIFCYYMMWAYGSETLSRHPPGRIKITMKPIKSVSRSRHSVIRNTHYLILTFRLNSLFPDTISVFNWRETTFYCQRLGKVFFQNSFY
jgi:hypothetical protein